MKLKNGLRNISKDALIHAKVTDVVLDMCSVLLSDSTVLRNIKYVGARPSVGDTVDIDYSNGAPIALTRTDISIEQPVSLDLRVSRENVTDEDIYGVAEDTSNEFELPDDTTGYPLVPETPVGDPNDEVIDVVSEDDCAENTEAIPNGPYLLWKGGIQYDNSRQSFYGRAKSLVRSQNHINKTNLNISAVFQTRNSGSSQWHDDDEADWYQVYGRKHHFGRVLTGTKESIENPDYRRISFSPPSSTPVDGFEIAIDPVEGSLPDIEANLEPPDTIGGASYLSSSIEKHIISPSEVQFHCTVHYETGWNFYIFSNLQFFFPSAGDAVEMEVTSTLSVPDHYAISSIKLCSSVDGYCTGTNPCLRGVFCNAKGCGIGTVVEIGPYQHGYVPSFTNQIYVTIRKPSLHRIVYDNVTVYNLCADNN